MNFSFFIPSFSLFISVIAFRRILHIFTYFSLLNPVVKDYIKVLEDGMQKNVKSQDSDMNSLYMNNSSILLLQ